ncbi:MAG TPA: cytochrome c oxidase subunit 3, partial [Micromonosporaceae bacterium]
PEVLERHAVRGASSAVMAMTLFVASEAVFFGAFFGIYASAYTQTKVWPPGDVSTPSRGLPSIAALILLLSAVTMAFARRAAHDADRPRRTTAWLWATLVAAIAFIALVAYGFGGLHFGIGQGIYESLFYTITALAIAHVAGGVVLLGLVVARARSGQLALAREPLVAASIYWYFVVVLGVVIYLLLYVAAG